MTGSTGRALSPSERVVGLDPPPAQELLPFLGDDPLEERLAELLLAPGRAR